MRKHAFCAFPRDDFAQAFNSRAANIGDAAKFTEKTLCGLRADTGNFKKHGTGLAFGPALTVECDGESVSFVADLLDEMEDWRMAVKNNRLVFLAVYVKDFLFFGDAGKRLIDDLQ